VNLLQAIIERLWLGERTALLQRVNLKVIQQAKNEARKRGGARSCRNFAVTIRRQSFITVENITKVSENANHGKVANLLYKPRRMKSVNFYMEAICRQTIIHFELRS